MKHIEEQLIDGRCDSFEHDSHSDYDPMYADAPGDDRPRCGGQSWEYGQWIGCPGCRHCQPVDPEAKPYGFGIEKFEDRALLEANADVANRWFGGPYQNLAQIGYFEPRGYTGRGIQYGANGRRNELRNEIWRTRTRWSARRWRHSELVWDRLCDECETHREAVKAYQQWAQRAITVRYRDEK